MTKKKKKQPAPPVTHTLRVLVIPDGVALIDALVEHPDPDVVTNKAKATFITPVDMNEVTFTLDMGKPIAYAIGEVVNQVVVFNMAKQEVVKD